MIGCGAEGLDQDKDAEEGDHANERRHACPAPFWELHQRQDEQRHTACCRQGTWQVEACGAGERRITRDGSERAEAHQESDRHVDEEDGGPAERPDQEAADDGTECQTAGAREAPQGERPVSLRSFLEQRVDQRYGRREQGGSADALCGARRDHGERRSGETAEQ
jgi:hypothetical protein